MSEGGRPDDPDRESDRQRANLIVLVVAAALVVVGVWLVNKLLDLRKMQECLESGRRNCVPIDVQTRRTW